MQWAALMDVQPYTGNSGFAVVPCMQSGEVAYTLENQPTREIVNRCARWDKNTTLFGDGSEIVALIAQCSPVLSASAISGPCALPVGSDGIVCLWCVHVRASARMRKFRLRQLGHVVGDYAAIIFS